MQLYELAMFAGVALCLPACSFDRPPPSIDGKACRSDVDCSGPQGICDAEGVGACVQCIPGQREEACDATTPVCTESLVCEPCQVHSDCMSDVCLPDGSCAMEAQVSYLKGGATGTVCTRLEPCGDFSRAISGNAARRFVRISGRIANVGASLFSRDLVLFGDPGGSVLQGRGGLSLPMLELLGSVQVELYDITLQDARDRGITLDSSSTLRMIRSKVENPAKEGIYSSGKVTLIESEIVGGNDAGKRGISIQRGELLMDRSRVAENEGGGIYVADGARFVVTNSFIVGNGAFGAFNSLSPANDSRLEFNTIVDNVSGGGSVQAGGVVCDNANVSARNNIIYRNSGGTGGQVQKLGQCNFTGSFEMFAAASDDTLKFKSDTTTPKDYHLTAASPASVRDVAGIACTGLKDFDGDDRPQGAGCDLGADELK